MAWPIMRGASQLGGLGSPNGDHFHLTANDTRLIASSDMQRTP